jgi:hypothetical protein
LKESLHRNTYCSTTLLLIVVCALYWGATCHVVGTNVSAPHIHTTRSCRRPSRQVRLAKSPQKNRVAFWTEALWKNMSQTVRTDRWDSKCPLTFGQRLFKNRCLTNGPFLTRNHLWRERVTTWWDSKSPLTFGQQVSLSRNTIESDKPSKDLIAQSCQTNRGEGHPLLLRIRRKTSRGRRIGLQPGIHHYCTLQHHNIYGSNTIHQHRWQSMIYCELIDLRITISCVFCILSQMATLGPCSYQGRVRPRHFKREVPGSCAPDENGIFIQSGQRPTKNTSLVAGLRAYPEPNTPAST